MDKIYAEIDFMVKNAKTLDDLLCVEKSKKLIVERINNSLTSHPFYQKLKCYNYVKSILEKLNLNITSIQKEYDPLNEIPQLLYKLVHNPKSLKLNRNEMGGIYEQQKTIEFETFKIIYHYDDSHISRDEWINIKYSKYPKYETKFLLHREGLMISYKPEKMPQLQQLKQRLGLANCCNNIVINLLKHLGKYGF